MDHSQRLETRYRPIAAAIVVGSTAWGSAIAQTDVAPPKQGFLSSLTQAFKQDFDHEIVRGHFDVGAPPDMHRYYCLVDEKTGKWQPNGVPGEPVRRADGMTGIKANAVSVYTCASAEEQGTLVTTGYVLNGVAPSASAAEQSTSAAPDSSSGKLDVGGVQLGAGADAVRAALRARKLPEYYESIQVLGSGRFVNVISAWSTGDEGESYAVMFTPTPGRERAMAIVHSVGYRGAGGIREEALAAALVKKYGGFASASEMPGSPTWRIQGSGSVRTGDVCDRRGILTKHDALASGIGAAQNLALTTTLDEFRFQIEHCGVTIITEDHSLAVAAATLDERTVTRYTVTGYSPAIGFDGASAAAQLMNSPAGRAGTTPPRARDGVVPNL